ncbi:S1C family serine protease [Patulibacter defluvii]|uniref:S1C family serine protease n=1 Tax=Patulibacter defluvii TaxID=3095358 RepID=UPI002A754740|nr:trypsin-like peptidase domain-containing protein [Patulibacter sp. DM4]
MLRPSRSLIVLCSAAVAGGAGGAVLVAAVAPDGRTTTVTQAAAVTAASRPVADTGGTALSAREIYQRSKDAVAFVTAAGGQGTATGSGFVVSADGYVVTNEHVIDGARRVTVEIGDRKAVPARVVGVDASTDVALLKVDSGGTRLPVLSLGDSTSVQVGDATYAIGNPYGLDRTLTTGVISALHRSIQSPNGYAINDVLQTDAALNPGNSGGPLLDAGGRVIGVNSQIATSSSASGGEGGNTGVGFAVPSSTVARVVEQLRTSGKASHAYLGVSTADGSSGGRDGATLAAVSAGGPAADGGLRRGDVVTAIDDRAVADAAALGTTVDAHRPGDEVTVHYRRGSDQRTAKVKLGERPAGTATDSSGGSGQPGGAAPDGGNGSGGGAGSGALPYDLVP